MTDRFVTIAVTLLEQSFTLRCPEASAPLLRKAAAFFAEQLNLASQQTGSKQFDRLAVVAALNVIYPMLMTEEELQYAVHERLVKLEAKIAARLASYKANLS